MRAYRIQKVISQNGSLELGALPFQEGEKVEIIILLNDSKSVNREALRGKVIEYRDPIEPVGVEDWDILK